MLKPNEYPISIEVQSMRVLIVEDDSATARTVEATLKT